MVNVVVNKQELLASIQQYKQQYEQVMQQLADLDAKKTLATKTIDMLSGAVQALEVLVQNIDALEAQSNGKPAPDGKSTPATE